MGTMYLKWDPRSKELFAVCRNCQKVWSLYIVLQHKLHGCDLTILLTSTTDNGKRLNESGNRNPVSMKVITFCSPK